MSRFERRCPFVDFRHAICTYNQQFLLIVLPPDPSLSLVRYRLVDQTDTICLQPTIAPCCTASGPLTVVAAWLTNCSKCLGSYQIATELNKQTEIKMSRSLPRPRLSYIGQLISRLKRPGTWSL